MSTLISAPRTLHRAPSGRTWDRRLKAAAPRRRLAPTAVLDPSAYDLPICAALASWNAVSPTRSSAPRWRRPSGAAPANSRRAATGSLRRASGCSGCRRPTARTAAMALFGEGEHRGLGQRSNGPANSRERQADAERLLAVRRARHAPLDSGVRAPERPTVMASLAAIGSVGGRERARRPGAPVVHTDAEPDASSPPSQAVIAAPGQSRDDGPCRRLLGIGPSRNQLRMNRASTTTFPTPWINPTRLARVPRGRPSSRPTRAPRPPAHR